MVLGKRSLLLVLCFVLLSSIGCKEEPQVIAYTTAKENFSSKLPPLKRMLGAMLPTESMCWFLKVTGEPEEIEQISAQFTEFAKSVQVTGTSDPKWVLPSGWTEKPGNEMRFRTIQVPVGQKQLDLSVTKLELSSNLDEALLANINRWRGQLQIPSVDAKDLQQAIQKVNRKGQSAIYLCDILGEPSQQGMMGAAPFASEAPDPSGSAAGSSAASASADPQVRTQPPAEWKPGQLNPMRKAAFLVNDGDQRAEITITFLTAAGGEVLPNVQRWRGQVGLPEIQPEELAKEVKSLEVGGEAAPYFVMHGPGDGKPQSLLVALVPRGDLVWFIKMMGDTPLVQREQQRFEEFARTVQFQ